MITGFFDHLPWDSEFFGIPIARLKTSRLDEALTPQLCQSAREEGLKCLYFEADPDDAVTIASAEQNRFHLVDVRIVLEHRFKEQPEVPVLHDAHPDGSESGSPRAEDMAELSEIAAEIGHTSRFHFDKTFGPEACDRLYRLWIQRACEGHADAVIVARNVDRGVRGVITCQRRGSVALIQLAGVKSSSRREGVGTQLVRMALDWARREHADTMEVVTQARNVQAQRLYQQMGFFTKSMSLYYHVWL